MTRPRIGVLALQGDFREHQAAIDASGATAVKVRRAHELSQVDGLILPGGESTTVSKLLDAFELREPLQAALRAGLPAFGSCAGMIMLASEIDQGTQWQQPLNALDVTVRRNGFGRQIDSFEVDLSVADLAGGPFHAVFIRAPWISRVGAAVEVLARVPALRAPERSTPEQANTDRIVCVRQGNCLATSFHPEIGADFRIHSLFLSMVKRAG